MDEQAVRDRAEELCAALVAGDMTRALETFSHELRQNVGEVVSLLPLPMQSATVESIEHSGSGDNVVLRFVGESDEDTFQTRWKDRDGKPTLIELSHLSRTEREPSAAEIEAEADGGGGAEGTAGV